MEIGDWRLEIGDWRFNIIFPYLINRQIIQYLKILSILINIRLTYFLELKRLFFQLRLYIKNKSNDDGYSHIGWVISTCDDFSEEAKMKAYENNISLINGKTFAEMLIRAGISSLEGNI